MAGAARFDRWLQRRKYAAHLPPERATKVIVPSGHACQEHPRTVAEIRRVVREHLKVLGR